MTWKGADGSTGERAAASALHSRTSRATILPPPGRARPLQALDRLGYGRDWRKAGPTTGQTTRPPPSSTAHSQQAAPDNCREGSAPPCAKLRHSSPQVPRMQARARLGRRRLGWRAGGRKRATSGRAPTFKRAMSKVEHQRDAGELDSDGMQHKRHRLTAARFAAAAVASSVSMLAAAQAEAVAGRKLKRALVFPSLTNPRRFKLNRVQRIASTRLCRADSTGQVRPHVTCSLS